MTLQEHLDNITDYKLTVLPDGSAHLTRSYWNPDRSYKAMNEKPYIFEEGTKMVDGFGNIVTITSIQRRPSLDGKAPQWTFQVKENGNTYIQYECKGIYVKSFSKDEVEQILGKGNQKDCGIYSNIVEDNVSDKFFVGQSVFYDALDNIAFTCGVVDIDSVDGDNITLITMFGERITTTTSHIRHLKAVNH